MTHKIDRKITGYRVKEKDQPVEVQEKIAEVMHEAIKRPDILHGSTYKIKPQGSDFAVYITINDMELDGVRYPYEIFINSKNMEHFQWVLAMTRLISAVWRKGGNCDFLIDELKSVFDPQGGYWKKSRFIPSIVADIGLTIEQHLKKSKQDMAKKMMLDLLDDGEEVVGEYPPYATLCSACNTKAMIIKDGCQSCLCCGDSKCG